MTSVKLNSPEALAYLSDALGVPVHYGDKPELSHRPLHQIAREINDDWRVQGKGVSPYARPYLDALHTLESIDENYYQDSADSVVRYFLANASTWKGEKARAIKKELNSLLK
jgi:hypothetical protein